MLPNMDVMGNLHHIIHFHATFYDCIVQSPSINASLGPNFNIITSDSVNGTLTLRLKDVPWDQALDLILAQKNLEKRQVGR